jgi:hypothetical protein
MREDQVNLLFFFHLGVVGMLIHDVTRGSMHIYTAIVYLVALLANHAMVRRS